MIVINSFSKTWARSGWRLGRITAPPPLGGIFEKVIEYHYPCPAHFSQLAGIIAVTEGENFVSDAVQCYQAARDQCVERLRAMQRVQLHSPPGTFYLFFAVNGMGDSVGICQRLVAETRVGLAPGAAFGEAGSEFLRLCFANSTETLTAALDRLQPLLD